MVDNKCKLQKQITKANYKGKLQMQIADIYHIVLTKLQITP